MLKKQLLAYLGMSLITFIVGFSFLFLKVGLRYTNALDLLAYRFSFAFLSIVLLRIFGLIKFPDFNFGKHKILLVLSLFYPFLFFLLQAYGMQYSSASEAGVIFSVLPIVTLIAARIFLKERNTVLQTTGIILSVAGVLYIVFSKTNFAANTANIQGIILLLLSVCSMVAYYVVGRKFGAKFSAMEITVWIISTAFITFVTISVSNHLYNSSLIDLIKPLYHTEFILSVLYLGVLSSVFTAFLMNYALPLIPASQISVFGNLSPIIAIFSGIVFLDENLHSYLVVGGLLVLTGIVMTLKLKK